jgi:hypothetical protein
MSATCALVPTLASLVIRAGAEVMLRRTPRNLPPIPPEALLIGGDLFPDGWTASSIDTGRAVSKSFDYEFDAAYQEFECKDEVTTRSWAFQDVARYETVSAAHKDYDIQNLSWSYPLAWPGLSDWSYEFRANEYSFFVGTDESDEGTVQRCHLTARYGRYVTGFHARVLDGALTAEQVKRIVMAIDEIFAEATE